MINIKDASLQDIPLIQQLAEQIWWPTYSPILTNEQIRYMLDLIYSPETIKKVMLDNTQHFILAFDENGPQGFASFGPRQEEPHILKLHKLYIHPNNQGKGYGKMLLEEVKRRALAINIHTLDLNVNRYNPACSFYRKIGFTIIREEDIPIGPYWMNDYVMRLVLVKG